MTKRNVTLIGLLGVGIALGGCNKAAPPAADNNAASQAPAAAQTAAAPAASATSASSAPSTPSGHTNAQGNEQPAENVASAAPQPEYAESATAPPPEIIVEVAPPPPRVEQVVARPGFVWIPGYWRWEPNSRRDIWISGTYVPQRQGFAWVPSRWYPGTDHRWHFRGGYWAQHGPGPRVPVAGPHVPAGPGVAGPHFPAGPGVNIPAPPAPRIEPIVQRPGFVWTPGYWRWDGNHYAWVSGGFVRARPGFGWVATRWTRDQRGTWQLEQGHWQHR